MFFRKKENKKEEKHAYVITWVQNNEFMWFTPKLQETEYVIKVFVNGAMNYLSEECTDNKLFDGLKLVAREATYKGL